MGPGEEAMMTMQAYDTLLACDTIIGYQVYLKLLGEAFAEKEQLSTPMKQERERCILCFEKAREGHPCIFYRIMQKSRGIQNQYIRLGLSYQISVARDIRYRHFQMKSIRQHMIIFLIHIIMYTKSSLLHTADPRIITLY